MYHTYVGVSYIRSMHMMLYHKCARLCRSLLVFVSAPEWRLHVVILSVMVFHRFTPGLGFIVFGAGHGQLWPAMVGLSLVVASLHGLGVTFL